MSLYSYILYLPYSILVSVCNFGLETEMESDMAPLILGCDEEEEDDNHRALRMLLLPSGSLHMHFFCSFELIWGSSRAFPILT